MALTIDKKKATDETADDSLPDDEEVVVAKKSDRERELELELAEKRGELKALKKTADPNQQLSIEQTKQLVYQDSNNLTDEDFQKKYRTSKHAAMMTVMDADNRQTKSEARQLHAEAKVSVRLSSKYSDFGKYDAQIRENIDELTEAARQDPEKLERWMERQYLALAKDSEKPLKKAASDDRRKIVQDFEKPKPDASPDKDAHPDTDDIADEIPDGSDISNQKLAGLLNLRSEKERKEINEKWKPGTEKGEMVAYVDMDLTCRDSQSTEKIMYRDPKKGFERVKIA